MCPFNRVLGGHLAGRRLRHHVADDEVVVDFVDGWPGRGYPGEADHCSESCSTASLSFGAEVGSFERIGIGFGTRLAKQGLL